MTYRMPPAGRVPNQLRFEDLVCKEHGFRITRLQIVQAYPPVQVIHCYYSIKRMGTSQRLSKILATGVPAPSLYLARLIRHQLTRYSA
jgi:hypothetical protein